MQIADYRIPAAEIDNQEAHRQAISQALKIKKGLPFSFRIIRRNIDARSKTIFYVLRAEVNPIGVNTVEATEFDFKYVGDKPVVHIVGSGPCGYFAALELILAGYKPVILERGKDVRERRRDLRAIQQDGIVNPDSNYCYGEGGAGTYSDGKLYTRSDKRGNIRRVLDLLVFHGADPDILIDVHPHIGSNKLPGIVHNIRMTIEKSGGEILFNTCLIDFVVEQGSITKLITNRNTIESQQVIIATGHSAREIYRLFYEKNLSIELKSFAIGVRIEHPQKLIDAIQYKTEPRPDYLPAASYALSCQVENKGVFSFCMCPGGLIIPAATAPGEMVVNGMSLSKRDSPFANSGIVTTVDPSDFKDFSRFGALQGMLYQAHIEKCMFELGDGGQSAPAQRLEDFLKNQSSKELPGTSYIPGIFPAALHHHLPAELNHRLKNGLAQFCKRLPEYLHKDAILVATESRTSAPVTIPRDRETLMHPQIIGLYPAGEGAGYAGGILSAAMDGQKVAHAVVANQFKSKSFHF
ncbi:MAG: FAD-binding protein [Saprospiraceae bacterium]|nr:FAD-binding protein [Saprospiraceae bacterium]